MLKLYEISDLYRDFLASVENGEIEDSQAISDTLDAIQQEFDAKIDNIACLIKAMNAEADAIDAEAKRLQDRARAKRNAAERMKNYISVQMQSIGQDRFENERNRISFTKSSSLQVLDDKALLASLQVAGRDDLYSIEETVTFDKKNIKKALKEGASLTGYTIIDKKNIQIK